MRKIEGEWRYFDDKLGMFYPWYTSPCLEFLETLDFRRKRIFEFGVGHSTKWFRTKGAVTDGVDNNLSWVVFVGTPCVRHEEYFPAYVDYIDIFKEQFDIIVIDGVWRDECAAKALPKLKPGGLLIIDNYKQPSVQTEWPQTEKLIDGMDVKYFKEPLHEDWQTIIVTK